MSSRTGPIYQWHDDVEKVEGYSAGGYHPVQLGDEYCQGRYRILNKLGYDSFSTVWLARNSIAHQYVSLKINAAKASKQNSEWCVLDELHRKCLEHPGRRFIPPRWTISGFLGRMATIYALSVMLSDRILKQSGVRWTTFCLWTLLAKLLYSWPLVWLLYIHAVLFMEVSLCLYFYIRSL